MKTFVSKHPLMQKKESKNAAGWDIHTDQRQYWLITDMRLLKGATKAECETGAPWHPGTCSALQHHWESRNKTLY